MPHITIKMFPGREDAIKQKLSARLAEVTAETLQVNASYVSVSIEDVPEKEWDEKVYVLMMQAADLLYIKPEYEE